VLRGVTAETWFNISLNRHDRACPGHLRRGSGKSPPTEAQPCSVKLLQPAGVDRRDKPGDDGFG
jgi:hypothetical protein